MVSDNNEEPQPQPDQQDDESIYDIFAEVKFESNPTMQKCWDVLGKLYYHYEVTDFLEPITVEKFGQQFYEDYFEVITTPMDIATIMQRMQDNFYLEVAGGDSEQAKELFKEDVLLIFKNCRLYNERGSDICRSAGRLQLEFRHLLEKYGLV